MKDQGTMQKITFCVDKNWRRVLSKEARHFSTTPYSAKQSVRPRIDAATSPTIDFGPALSTLSSGSLTVTTTPNHLRFLCFSRNCKCFIACLVNFYSCLIFPHSNNLLSALLQHKNARCRETGPVLTYLSILLPARRPTVQANNCRHPIISFSPARITLTGTHFILFTSTFLLAVFATLPVHSERAVGTPKFRSSQPPLRPAHHIPALQLQHRASFRTNTGSSFQTAIFFSRLLHILFRNPILGSLKVNLKPSAASTSGEFRMRFYISLQRSPNVTSTVRLTVAAIALRERHIQDRNSHPVSSLPQPSKRSSSYIPYYAVRFHTMLHPKSMLALLYWHHTMEKNMHLIQGSSVCPHYTLSNFTKGYYCLRLLG
ncbi:uncharacterized protein BDR25DRAFT_393696 [Lindgomyces ingoldianus]|uniref:Uncharacterized protein n=1 Tax=Lindgomyces ingoldianus TaxID=673940 RepID=A0ACB6QUG0_9PLEO|nr:uncharacterized protein BDR25DRAFT_393696 [Lindgomyces ingoldianus]KAF2470581.1 hypothetical protein BDR25DRAFT_393696 [Lindgomyces ingoldianus]